MHPESHVLFNEHPKLARILPPALMWPDNSLCVQRFLNMKLMYHGTTPEEYEPPFFKQHDASPSHFVSKPFGL